jgi:hypothetical protein
MGIAHHLVLVVALGVAQAPAAAQAVNDGRAVDVSADKEWTDTGIDVVAGDPLYLAASGEWGNGSYRSGPAGTPDPNMQDARLPTAAPGSLIGRIGDMLFAVGDRRDEAAPATGRLFLGMNDAPGRFADNQDALSVGIEYVRHDAAPDPDEKDDAESNQSTPDVERPITAAAPAEPPIRRESRLRPVPRPRVLAPEPAATPPWFLAAAFALLVALALALALWWRRTRLGARTRARLLVAHSLSSEPAAGGPTPPDIAPAWPTVGTRWRVEEKEPAFRGWAGEEERDG